MVSARQKRGGGEQQGDGVCSAAVAVMVTAKAAMATTTAAVAGMVTAIVAMVTATAAVVAMATAMTSTMAATMTLLQTSLLGEFGRNIPKWNNSTFS